MVAPTGFVYQQDRPLSFHLAVLPNYATRATERERQHEQAVQHEQEVQSPHCHLASRCGATSWNTKPGTAECMSMGTPAVELAGDSSQLSVHQSHLHFHQANIQLQNWQVVDDMSGKSFRLLALAKGVVVGTDREALTCMTQEQLESRAQSFELLGLLV